MAKPSSSHDLSQPSSPASPGPSPLCALARQGWIGVAVWMTVGLLLESLLAFKTPAYLNDSVRRELFRLAHTHGTLLSLLLVLAAVWSPCSPRPLRPILAHCLRTGTVLMPVGFLLSGIWHFESDPGFAIWLVPIGAVLTIFSTIALAIASGVPSAR